MEKETYKYVLALKVAEPKWAVKFIAGTEIFEANKELMAEYEDEAGY